MIKRVGQDPLLFHYSMERDEAARTGLRTKNLDDYSLEELFKEAGGDSVKFQVARYRRMLADAGVEQGRLAIYGQGDAGVSYAVFTALQQALPDLTIVGEVIEQRFPGSHGYQGRRRDRAHPPHGAGHHRGGWADRRFPDLAQGQRRRAGPVGGSPLTIGDVKRRINLWLAERGAENPEDCIFAIGRDAGVPHSAGTPSDPMRLGQTIVFDIFPCEAGGGYFYDFTRTWCLGYAPDEAQALYEDVLDTYQAGHQRAQKRGDLQELPGAHLRAVRSAWPSYRAQPPPHPGRLRPQPGTRRWPAHPRKPLLRLHFPRQRPPEPGVIITIEPGLYYPERGLGVRLEDTLWVRPDGAFEVLAQYPYDLVLPVKSS